MRVREVVTRSRKGFRGYFPSRKLNRGVQFESLLERDAIYIWEFSPGVISYQEQPAIIEYEHQGSIHRYVPDFELQLRNQHVIHAEIKPERALSNPKLRAKYTSIARRYQETDIEYVILTERELRQIPLLPNLKFLYRGLRSSRNIDFIILEIRRYLQDQGACLFSILTQEFDKEAVVMMLARNYLACDFKRDFDAPDNLIRLPGEADYATLWF